MFFLERKENKNGISEVSTDEKTKMLYGNNSVQAGGESLRQAQY